MERPPWRTERKSDTMSCTAPMKMQPIITQATTAPQPKYAAAIGPTIGPAPAIDAKWWPKRTAGCAGTKSMPSPCVWAGVSREESIPSSRDNSPPYTKYATVNTTIDAASSSAPFIFN